MEENIDIFDFELNGEEMAKLRDLDAKKSKISIFSSICLVFNDLGITTIPH